MKREIHGMRDTILYKKWSSMKSRCNNKKRERYKNYGGRGIKVCPKWNDSFVSFYNDMASTYKDGYSLERKNNDKGYSKENCIWIPLQEQYNNKQNSLRIKYNGEILNLKQWSVKLGINYGTLYQRIMIYKWKPEEAFKRKVDDRMRVKRMPPPSPHSQKKL